MCVQEVVCGRRTRLLHCDLEIGVDCTLATYSGVELAVPKTACCQFHQAVRDSVCPMRGGSVKLSGRIMGINPHLIVRFGGSVKLSGRIMGINPHLIVRFGFYCSFQPLSVHS